MRVALTFPACHRRGGVERVLVECANFLRARGHETHVYAVDLDETVLDAGVTAHRLPGATRPGPVGLLSYGRRSRAALDARKGDFGVIGGFGVPAHPEAVVWVQAVHKAWLEVSRRQRTWKGRLRQRLNPYHPLILGMERRAYRGGRYKKLIALSRQVKDDLMRFYGVPDEDIVIIPNGFAPDEFNHERRRSLRREMRETLGYLPTDRVVVFVANELERKGFGPLLRGIAALGDPGVHLLAVGRLNVGAYAGEIARLGMRERVRFTGPSGDVATYYAAADVFALPTQYEAWGLVITEAMACGLPVLTSRLAGAAAAVQEGASGLLLDDPGDVGEIAAKIETLLRGRHDSDAEIAASVAEYAWPRVLLRYEALLLECAGEVPAI